jgi:hypothetical protein
VNSQEQACHQLACYTLARGDPAFIHQHVVDAYAAQTADADTKPITLAFALIGLYLHVERGFTGRQVQRVHGDLARYKRVWPAFPLPEDRGAMTAEDVMAVAEGRARDRAIEGWCLAVWGAYVQNHEKVAAILREYGL